MASSLSDFGAHKEELCAVHQFAAQKYSYHRASDPALDPNIRYEIQTAASYAKENLHLIIQDY